MRDDSGPGFEVDSCHCAVRELMNVNRSLSKAKLAHALLPLREMFLNLTAVLPGGSASVQGGVRGEDLRFGDAKNLTRLMRALAATSVSEMRHVSL